MGEVWKAHDSRLDRTVAIKIAKAGLDPRLDREARAVAALNHPNICQIYDVGPDYIVMELVAGEPIKGPMPADRAAALAGQILDALDAAHRKGIVHRDLKPDNIFVTRQGVKLLDFGLAKQAVLPGGADADTVLTRALTTEGQILGTLQYMSPEQLQGHVTDARSDIFSFGCVLYELLCGKRAFDGASAASVIAAVLEREPAHIDIHPPLDRVVRRCLAKDPEHRFQNALDLKTALDWALESSTSVAATQGRRWWIVAVVAVAAVTAFAAGWLLSRGAAPSEQTTAQAVRMAWEPPAESEFLPGGVAVSPDGGRVVISAASRGKRGLWIRGMQSADARPLPGVEDGDNPFWSPDGKSIGYFARGGRLMRLDLDGGEPVTVAERVFPRGAAWTPSGDILLGNGNAGLLKVPASGGEPQPFTTLDASRGETAHRFPQLLPGGRLLYYAQCKDSANSGAVVTSLSGPDAGRKFVMAAASNALYSAGHLLWLRGSTLMAQTFDPASGNLSGEPRQIAASVNSGGPFGGMHVAASPLGNVLVYAEPSLAQFTWFDREGWPLHTFGDAARYGSFRLSPDGTRLAAVRQNNAGGSEIWVEDLERGVWSRFASERGVNMSPVWWPDSRRLLFRAREPWQVLAKDLNSGDPPTAVTDGSRNASPVDVSRDGRYLIANSGEGPQTVFTLNAAGALDAAVKPLTMPVRAMPVSWRFQPGPKPAFVLYESRALEGPSQIEVRSFPDGDQVVQISGAGGGFAEWSHDGKEIFFVSPDRKLMVVSVAVADGKLRASAPSALFEIEGTPFFAPSPDGKRFLMLTQVERPGRPLEVVVNWTSLRP